MVRDSRALWVLVETIDNRFLEFYRIGVTFFFFFSLSESSKHYCTSTGIHHHQRDRKRTDESAAHTQQLGQQKNRTFRGEKKLSFPNDWNEGHHPKDSKDKVSFFQFFFFPFFSKTPWMMWHVRGGKKHIPGLEWKHARYLSWHSSVRHGHRQHFILSHGQVDR